MKTKRINLDTQKQRYIPIGKKLIPVSEEVYLLHSRWIANERHRARRDHRCGNPDFRSCNGDCGRCYHQIPGDVLYTDSLIDTDRDHTTDGEIAHDIPDNAALVEDIVLDRMLLASLFERLDALMPNGADIFRLIANGFTERQVADKLGIRQSTLNYRKNKLFTYIREHRNELR